MENRKTINPAPAGSAEVRPRNAPVEERTAARLFRESAAAPVVKGDPQQLPRLALAVAALTVFDAVLLAVFGILWLFDGELLFRMLQSIAGISLLLGIAPIVAGGFILQKNKKTGIEMPGTVWATYGIAMGILLALMTLMIPMVMMFRSLFSSPGGLS